MIMADRQQKWALSGVQSYQLLFAVFFMIAASFGRMALPVSGGQSLAVYDMCFALLKTPRSSIA
jgi:hypothetical protein